MFQEDYNQIAVIARQVFKEEFSKAIKLLRKELEVKPIEIAKIEIPSVEEEVKENAKQKYNRGRG